MLSGFFGLDETRWQRSGSVFQVLASEPVAVLVDGFEEGLSVAFQLGLADAADVQEFGFVGGELRGHLAQAGVAEDHVGRHVGVVGKAFAQDAEFFWIECCPPKERSLCRARQTIKDLHQARHRPGFFLTWV